MSWSPAALLRPPGFPPVRDAGAWRTTLDRLESSGSFALAVNGGRRSGTVGWAFSFGYQAALRALLPDHAAGRVAALCATEAGGNHPRAIETRLQDGLLTGEKSFVSLGPLAELLVVVARTGTDDHGRPRLVGCTVDARHAGVQVRQMPPLPVVPEVPHGSLHLSDAVPITVLDGDGYTGLLKPFRTVEDIHVHAALASWMLGVARDAGWPDDFVEALLVGISGLSHAATLSPSDPGTHRLLGGALTAFHALVARAEPLWSSASPEVAEMWARDRALMRIASGARKARLGKARRALGEGASPSAP